MARRRRKDWLGAAAQWYRQTPAEVHETWDDYEKAKCDERFSAVHRAYVEGGDDAAINPVQDRLIEMGLDRHLERVLGIVKAARTEHDLPF